MGEGVHGYLDFAELDDLSAAAYGHAVELGRFDKNDIAERLSVGESELVRIEQVLRLLKLLQPMPGHPSVLVPVGPDVAAADLVGGAENQIRDLQQAVTDVRSKLLSLTPLYFEGRRLRNRLEAFDVISDPSVIRSMIDSLGKSCRHELLAMHPGGPRPAFVLASARDSNSRMLERGVRVKTIYQHTARGDLATKSFVRDVTALGAEFRTADELVDRVLIYDRETVVLARHTGADGTPTAAIVRESTLVGFVCKVFEYIWDGATPFNPETAKAEAITDDLKQSVLRLMAKGYKDEMVARRLGMSVRTCRRHISEITEELEATSRFQAGFNVAMSGILDQFKDEF